MLADLFSSAELDRVIDFLLDEPGRAFNKSELAEGADISRPTVYKLLPHLSSLGLVTTADSSGGAEGYRLNTQSTLVRSLLRFDNELSKNMAQAGISTPEPHGEIAAEIAPEA